MRPAAVFLCSPDVPAHFPHGLLCNSLHRQRPWIWTLLLPLTQYTLPGLLCSSHSARAINTFVRTPLHCALNSGNSLKFSHGLANSLLHVFIRQTQHVSKLTTIFQDRPSSYVSAPIPTLPPTLGMIKLTFPPPATMLVWLSCPVDLHLAKISPVCSP